MVELNELGSCMGLDDRVKIDQVAVGKKSCIKQLVELVLGRLLVDGMWVSTFKDPPPIPGTTE